MARNTNSPAHDPGVLDAYGHEIVDPTPMDPPIGYKKQPTMMERVREMIRAENLAKELAAQGEETFEEADDFDTGEDDLDPHSPYEEHFEPHVSDREVPQALAAALTPALAPEPSPTPQPGGASPAASGSPLAGSPEASTR